MRDQGRHQSLSMRRMHLRENQNAKILWQLSEQPSIAMLPESARTQMLTRCCLISVSCTSRRHPLCLLCNY